MAITLRVVQSRLEAAADEPARAATARLVPTAQRAYGVRVPILNALIKECRPGGFELVEALWKAGAFEERLLAAKLLGALARQDPPRAVAFLTAASKDLSDWAVCDTLGTQGVRTIARRERDAIFALAKRLAHATNPWSRRFAIVLLLNFARVPQERVEIRRILAPLRADREPYVRKALLGIDKDLRASGQRRPG